MEQQIAVLLQQVMEMTDRLRQNEESSAQVRQLLEAHRTAGQMLEERMNRTAARVRDTSQAGGSSAARAQEAPGADTMDDSDLERLRHFAHECHPADRYIHIASIVARCVNTQESVVSSHPSVPIGSQQIHCVRLHSCFICHWYPKSFEMFIWFPHFASPPLNSSSRDRSLMNCSRPCAVPMQRVAPHCGAVVHRSRPNLFTRILATCSTWL